jgi:hypothetical protein
MFRLIIVVGLFCNIGIVHAADAKDVVSPKLQLQCDVLYSNYAGIHHAEKHAKVTLQGLKQQAHGAKLITQTKDYEFWVMIHGLQTIGEHTFINNFQVAIRNKHTKEFYHALSDSSYSPKYFPHQARISLVEYQPNTFLEKGELLFECRRLD